MPAAARVRTRVRRLPGDTLFGATATVVAMQSNARTTPMTSRRVGIVVLALLLAACGAPSPSGTGQSASAGPVRTARPAATPPPTSGLSPVGATETARVVRVVDGDTIVIDRGHGDERVRYIGIDTPESVKPNTPVEFMAKEASAANAALVEGREIVLEKDVSDTDRYDRLLRYAWLRDGDGWVFVNLELVSRGFAQVATFPPDVRWIETFLAAERVAREAGLGLWGPVTPVP
jgi:micrococcal nuclease